MLYYFAVEYFVFAACISILGGIFLDIIDGIFALIFVLIILVMKESENKLFASIGIGIILIAKLLVGAEGIFEDLISLLLILGVVISIVLLNNYRKNKKFDAELNMIDKIKKKHTLEEFGEIAQWEQDLRFERTKLDVLLKQHAITDEKYSKGLKDILKKRDRIQRRYNVTSEEMQEYYLFAKND